MVNQQNKHISIPVPLSVVMSVYNGEEYLAEAIDSILTQTFRDFEFIIINDGSTDGSSRILHEYAARDPRIRLVKQANTGLTAALCRGVELSRGQYVARMDADDISLPHRFERQIALLEAQPDLAASTCTVEYFSNEGSDAWVAKLAFDPRLFPLYMCFANRIGGHGQIMFRRSAYDAAGGYDPTFRYAQDYDLWTRMLDVGGFGIVPETLYRFRTGHDSITKRYKSEQAQHSLRNTRRQYQKITGHAIDLEIAQAMRNFSWKNDLGVTDMSHFQRAADAMSRAIGIFFEGHPELRREEFGVRRQLAARWWWRRREIGASDWWRTWQLYSIVLKLGVLALIAKAKGKKL